MYDLYDIYDESYSPKNKKSVIALTEAMIADYENANATNKAPKYRSVFEEEANAIFESEDRKDLIHKRYSSFAETVRCSLVLETLYDMYKKSVPKHVTASNENCNIMRGIVSNYVNETGWENILEKMKTASPTMAEKYNMIMSSSKAMLEQVDKNNPETFHITPEMKDEFFAQLDYSDSQAIEDAIHDRVSDAMNEFINANAEDHDNIAAALQKAQDKIAKADPEDEELREFYQVLANREINEIRNSRKNVLHGMISAMSENVVKHNDKEFFTEGHLDMDKIVTRTSLMYTFMEMMNTTRLQPIDEVFIEDIISNLKG